MPHNSLLEIVKRIQRVYSADTAKVLLKSKLIVTTTKKGTTAIKYAMFKDFRYDRADWHATEVVNSNSFTINIAITFQKRHTIQYIQLYFTIFRGSRK